MQSRWQRTSTCAILVRRINPTKQSCPVLIPVSDSQLIFFHPSHHTLDGMFVSYLNWYLAVGLLTRPVPNKIAQARTANQLQKQVPQHMSVYVGKRFEMRPKTPPSKALTPLKPTDDETCTLDHLSRIECLMLFFEDDIPNHPKLFVCMGYICFDNIWWKPGLCEHWRLWSTRQQLSSPRSDATHLMLYLARHFRKFAITTSPRFTSSNKVPRASTYGITA